MGCAPLAVPPALIKVGMRLRLTLLPVHFLSRLPRDPARFTPVALRFLRHRVLLLRGDCTRIAMVTPLPPGEGGAKRRVRGMLPRVGFSARPSSAASRHLLP